jgi:8-oxo-dGTP pyrophosphatase MutT (NUDIX family)
MMTDNLILNAELTPADAVAAIISVEGSGYLMQLRDDIPGIFYPGHWGLFGGAIESGETAEEALVRELEEELALNVVEFQRFTEMTFDFSYAGVGTLKRVFFELIVPKQVMADLRLGEGREMRLFSVPEVLGDIRVVPYDAWALWQHANRDFIASASA